jgi:hypothetical protein
MIFELRLVQHLVDPDKAVCEIVHKETMRVLAVVYATDMGARLISRHCVEMTPSAFPLDAWQFDFVLEEN